MRIKQLVTQNIGIVRVFNTERGYGDKEEPEYQGTPKGVLSGYQHHDAVKWIDETSHNSYKNLAQDILKLFPNANNILELGCGSGSLAFFLRQYKPEAVVVTTDGNMEAAVNGPYIDKNYHLCIRTDQPFIIANEHNEIIKFDLILSFEHFEHIKLATLPILLQNIKNHSLLSTITIATAANYSYDYNGDRHVHCTVMPMSQWCNFLQAYGFIIRQDIKVLTNNNKPFNIHNIEDEIKDSYTNEIIFQLKI